MALPIYQPQLQETALPSPTITGHDANAYGLSVYAAGGQFLSGLKATLDEIEDFETMEAVKDFRFNVDKYLHDPNKGIYNTALGKNALGVTDVAGEHIGGLWNDSQSRLRSFRARKNFERMTQDYMLSTQRGLMGFESQEIDKYETDQTRSRIDMLLNDIGLGADFETTTQEIVDTYVRFAGARGKGDEEIAVGVQSFVDNAALTKFQKLWETDRDEAIRFYSGDKKAFVQVCPSVGYVGGHESLTGAVEKNISRYDNLIVKYADMFGVPANFVRAMIYAESGGDPNATSTEGAMGLMQLIPATAKDMGVTDPYDPEQNIMGGVKYISNLMRRSYLANRWDLIAGAYNSGPNKESYKNGQLPDITQTKNHSAKVMRLFGSYNSKSDMSITPALEFVAVIKGKEGIRSRLSADMQSKIDDAIEVIQAQEIARQFSTDPSYKGAEGLVRGIEDIKRSIPDPTLADKTVKEFENSYRQQEAIRREAEADFKQQQIDTFEAYRSQIIKGEILRPVEIEAALKKGLITQGQATALLQMSQADQNEILRFGVESGTVNQDVVESAYNAGRIDRSQYFDLMRLLSKVDAAQAKAEREALKYDAFLGAAQDITSDPISQERIANEQFWASNGLSFIDVNNKARERISRGIYDGTITASTIDDEYKEHRITREQRDYFKNLLNSADDTLKIAVKGIFDGVRSEFNVPRNNNDAPGNFFRETGVNVTPELSNILDGIRAKYYNMANALVESPSPNALSKINALGDKIIQEMAAAVYSYLGQEYNPLARDTFGNVNDLPYGVNASLTAEQNSLVKRDIWVEQAQDRARQNIFLTPENFFETHNTSTELDPYIYSPGTLLDDMTRGVASIPDNLPRLNVLNDSKWTVNTSVATNVYPISGEGMVISNINPPSKDGRNDGFVTFVEQLRSSTGEINKVSFTVSGLANVNPDLKIGTVLNASSYTSPLGSTGGSDSSFTISAKVNDEDVPLAVALDMHSTDPMNHIRRISSLTPESIALLPEDDRANVVAMQAVLSGGFVKGGGTATETAEEEARNELRPVSTLGELRNAMPLLEQRIDEDVSVMPLFRKGTKAAALKTITRLLDKAEKYAQDSVDAPIDLDMMTIGDMLALGIWTKSDINALKQLGVKHLGGESWISTINDTQMSLGRYQTEETQ